MSFSRGFSALRPAWKKALGGAAALAVVAAATVDAGVEPAMTEGETRGLRDMLASIERKMTVIEAKLKDGGAAKQGDVVAVNRCKDDFHFLADQTSEKVKMIAKNCRYYTEAFSPKAVPAFYDLSGITENAEAFQATVDIFVDRYRAQPAATRPTVVVGYDARGFVLGPPIALALGLPFVLLRKAGKNPGPLVTSTAYSKEYKEHQPDQMCVRLGALKAGDRVLLIDDLIATGGTALAGFELCDALGATVSEFGSIIEIPVCNGVEKIRAWPAALEDDGTIRGAETGKFANVPIFSVLDSATVHALRPKPDDPAGWHEPSKNVPMSRAVRIMNKYGLGR